jgi:hypothetical protein
VLSDYRAALATAALSPHARRGYASRVAGFLDWLDTGPDLGADVDPLAQPTGRDYAVRDYRSWLKTVRRATPWTVNAHLTALDHFYAHHLGLGAPGHQARAHHRHRAGIPGRGRAAVVPAGLRPVRVDAQRRDREAAALHRPAHRGSRSPTWTTS